MSAFRFDVKFEVTRPDAASVKYSLVGGNPRGEATRCARVYNFGDCAMRDYRSADNTVANLLRALQTRVYIPSTCSSSPEDGLPIDRNRERKFLRYVASTGRRLSRQVQQPLSPEGMTEALKKFPPRKREMYGAALDEPLGPIKRASRISSFIKEEWTPVKPGKMWKPRVIQFRDPLFLAHFMQYYKPFEHAFYHGRWVFNRTQKFTCAKGFNPHQRAVHIRKLVSELDDCHVVGLDGSAFDAHVTVAALNAEAKFFDASCETWSQRDRQTAQEFFRAQRLNKCRARCKDGFVRYRTVGNRMSGDLNTGCGNSVLQSLYIAFAMTEFGVPETHWRMFVDGDDALLFLSGKYKDVATRLPTFFLSFGHEVKVDGCEPVNIDRLEAVDFCQGRMVFVGGEWRLVRNPFKVINCYMRTFRWSQSDELFRRYLATVAPPEMIINSGVPILHKFFSVCHQIGGDAKPLDSVARNFWRRSECGVEPMAEIDDKSRESFARAFGISPADQQSMEVCLESTRDGIWYVAQAGVNPS